MPGQECRGRNGEDRGPAPTRYEPCQSGEPYPVGWLVPDRASVAAQYRVLVAEDQQLSILRPVAREHKDRQAEHAAGEQVDDVEQHPDTQPSPHPSAGNSAGQPRNRVFERHMQADATAQACRVESCGCCRASRGRQKTVNPGLGHMVGQVRWGGRVTRAGVRRIARSRRLLWRLSGCAVPVGRGPRCPRRIRAARPGRTPVSRTAVAAGPSRSRPAECPS